MATVVQCDTNLTNWHFASLAKVLQLFFVVIFLRTKGGSFHYILIVLVLKIIERQDTVIFVAFHDAVPNYALLVIITIATFRAYLVAISTFQRAISPLSASPWAAMCIRLTEFIAWSTECFVADSPIKGLTPRSVPIISASFLAHITC